LTHTTLIAICYAGCMSGSVALIVHSLEAVRMGEHRPVRASLVVLAAVGAALSVACTVLAAREVVPRLDTAMFPVAAAASLGLGGFYGRVIHSLLAQRAIVRRWRLAFTAATTVELAFAFMSVWLTTTALVMRS
jgi:hypothetical protein